MKRKATLKKPNYKKELANLRSVLYAYQGADRVTLLERYPNHESILQRLRDIPTDIETYEFLGELFFQFLAQEIESEMINDKTIKLCKNTRYDVMQFYELARAAKMLKNT